MQGNLVQIPKVVPAAAHWSLTAGQIPAGQPVRAVVLEISPKIFPIDGRQQANQCRFCGRHRSGLVPTRHPGPGSWITTLLPPTVA